MKKPLLILFLLFTLFYYSTEKLYSQNKFKLDPNLLDGLSLVKINDDMLNIGFTKNPETYTNRDVIRSLSMAKPDNIIDVYMEVYLDKRDRHDHIGVIVYHFDSNGSLNEYLEGLIFQNNTFYLIKDSYLIKIWSDESSPIKEKRIDNMINYYKDKLQANPYTIIRDEMSTDTIQVVIDSQPYISSEDINIH